jgi:hypothetical protein
MGIRRMANLIIIYASANLSGGLRQLCKSFVSTLILVKSIAVPVK